MCPDLLEWSHEVPPAAWQPGGLDDTHERSGAVTQRTKISKPLRFQILRRDNHTCRYCGAKAPESIVVVDHVVPVALGGQTVPENLVTACQDCNQGKASTPPDASHIADVQADAVRWSQAMRTAAAIQMQALQEREQYAQTVDEAWHGWTWDDGKQVVPRPENWRNTIDHWFDLGLELEIVLDLLTTAMRNNDVYASNTWRYFCGCVWRRLRERAELAQNLLNAEGPEGGP